MNRVLLFICLALSVGLVAAGYIIGAYLIPAVILLVLGIGWAVGLILRWSWVSGIGLFVLYLFAALGFFLDLGAVWLILGGIFALLTWDLADFEARLRLASPEDTLGGIKRSHYLRLALVVGIGLVLSYFSLTMKMEFSFEAAAALVLVSIWGIGRLVYSLLRRD